MHRADADRAGCGHGGRGPVGGLTGRSGQRQGDDTLGHRRAEGRDARGAGLVPKQPLHARLHETPLPAPHAGLGFAGHAHDPVGADVLRRKQHDLGAPDMLLRAVPIRRDLSEAGMIGRTEADDDTDTHCLASHTPPETGIPSGTLPSGVIH